MEFLIANPLAMVGVFAACVALPLLYEAIAYLRARRAGLDEAVEAPAPAPVPVETKPARRKRKH